MSDVFIEKIVPQKRSSIDFLKIAGVFFVYLLLILITLMIPFLLFLFPLALFGGAYLFYLFIAMSKLEHEYIVTNGTLDIDRIYGMRRRKRQISISARDIQEISNFNSNKYADFQRKRVKILDYSSKNKDSQFVYMLINNNGQDTAVIIEKDDRILENIYQYNRRLMYS